MGKILSKMKASVAEDMISSITSNTAKYYAFVSNPVEDLDAVDTETLDFFSSYHENINTLIFGKKLANTDIVPVIENIPWTTNTVYSRYDNTRDLSNSDFYVVAAPAIVGGVYHVYKCIDNANGAASTEKPDQIQASSFTKSDGYTWRYIYSISAANYTKFATTNYVPVYSNTTIVSGAYTYSGVEVVPIVNAGAGYDTYHSGTVRSNPNSTVIQIENEASSTTNFYQNNAIYLTNNSAPTAQLLTISQYVSNASGNWVILSEAANTTNITAGITNYAISPRVKFDTDGDEQPKAYTIVSNTTNSIANVVIIDPGYGITRANASIVTSVVASVTVTANVYCIVPHPGGHGSAPEAELNTKGLSISISFSGTESNTVPTNILYNKIGLLKNPYTLNANNTKGSAYSANTFKSYVDANVSGYTYTVGDTLTGNTSNAKGIVAFANSSRVYIVGDKHFETDETVVDGANNSATITINSLGDIYTKDLYPIYYRNVSDVTRSNTQTESFKLIVEV